MSAPLDISGHRFGRLTALRRSGSTRRGRAIWLCLCECGRRRLVTLSNLRCGSTRSCGCLRQEKCAVIGSIVGPETVHGHARRGAESPEYRSWQAMKNRCTNKRLKAWKNYGGRGISVCARWANSFENFLSDMGPRPEGTSLDRFPDNDGNYEPGNCRWATRKQQQANKRRRTYVP